MRLIILLLSFTILYSNIGIGQQADILKNQIKNTLAHQRKYNDKSGFDMRFYHIALDVNYQKYLKGNVLCEFMSTKTNLSQIKLKLAKDYKITRIIGASQQFQHKEDELVITLKKPLKIGQVAWIKIFYEGEGVTKIEKGMKRGIYKSLPNQSFYLASLNSPKSAFLWFPSKTHISDKADSVYLDLTIPDTMINDIPVIAVGNGQLQDISIKSTKRTFKWRHQYPIATHHIIFTISNYRTIQQSVDFNDERMKITHYVFPKDYFDYLEYVSDLPDMIRFFSEKFGNYPFSKNNLGVTQIGSQEYVEAQTKLIVANIKEENNDDLIYCLAKSWFGHQVASGSPYDNWIYESLSRYAIALWYQWKGGESEYWRELNRLAYLEEGTIYGNREDMTIYEDIHKVYKKGAYMFHMLRELVGDKVFFNILKSFTQNYRFKYNFANTKDFVKLCEDASGQKLDYFFNQWLYGEYFPIYNYKYSKSENKKITLEIVQIKRATTPTYFTMPIDVKITFDDFDTTIQVFNNKQSQKWELDFQFSKINDLEIDPENKILKHVALKEQRLNSKGLIRDMKVEAEDNSQRLMTLSMRAFTRQWVILELKTLDNQRAYYEEIIVEDQFNSTIKIPESVPVGSYRLFLSTNSSIFSRDWNIGI